MTTVPPPRPAELIPLPHSGLSVTRFYAMHFLGAAIPLLAGLLLNGWRGTIELLLIIASTLLGVAVWRGVGPRGRQLCYAQALWLAMLLAMMLPAQLVSGRLPAGSSAPWCVLPAAGLLLALFLWLLGGLGAGRVHPLLATYICVATLFYQLLVPHWVLQRNHLLLGDLLAAKMDESRAISPDGWYKRFTLPGQDAEFAQPASEALTRYTGAMETAPRGWLPIQSLLRDDLPPLEDLVIGGHPAPLGLGSEVAVIIGGLCLFYRGLIDFRVPLLILVVAMAGFLLLPIPPLLSEHTQWHWIVSRRPGVGWATGITFANYELMASPLLFMAFFLATAPSIRPMSRRARVLFAAIAGAGSAALQLYMSVSLGPYVALLIASLLTPALDRWFKPRTMI